MVGHRIRTTFDLTPSQQSSLRPSWQPQQTGRNFSCVITYSTINRNWSTLNKYAIAFTVSGKCLPVETKCCSGGGRGCSSLERHLCMYLWPWTNTEPCCGGVSRHSVTQQFRHNYSFPIIEYLICNNTSGIVWVALRWSPYIQYHKLNL